MKLKTGVDGKVTHICAILKTSPTGEKLVRNLFTLLKISWLLFKTTNLIYRSRSSL